MQVKIFRVAALCVLGLWTAACVAEEKVSFVALTGQQAIIRDGIAGLISNRTHTTVAVSPASRQVNPGNRPILIVGVRNEGTTPVNFLLSNVRVRQTVGGKVVRELPVKTYEQLVQEERTRQVMTALLVGVAAGANSAAAANRYNGPIANQIALNQASYENANLVGNAAAAGQFNLASLEANVLKDNTVMPGEWVGGQLHFAAPEDLGGAPKTYSLVIQLGEDTHVIEINQSRVPQA